MDYDLINWTISILIIFAMWLMAGILRMFAPALEMPMDSVHKPWNIFDAKSIKVEFMHEKWIIVDTTNCHEIHSMYCHTKLCTI